MIELVGWLSPCETHRLSIPVHRSRGRHPTDRRPSRNYGDSALMVATDALTSENSAVTVIPVIAGPFLGQAPVN